MTELKISHHRYKTAMHQHMFIYAFVDASIAIYTHSECNAYKSDNNIALRVCGRTISIELSGNNQVQTKHKIQLI